MCQVTLRTGSSGYVAPTPQTRVNKPVTTSPQTTKPAEVTKPPQDTAHHNNVAAHSTNPQSVNFNRRPVSSGQNQQQRTTGATVGTLPRALAAGGMFQELRYPVLRNYPGPQRGTTSRFDLSFRDKSGFKGKATSEVYLNRNNPGTRWKGLRLDHGPNTVTGNTDWHWNQKGAGSAFGVVDHQVATSAERNLGRVMKVAKPLGRAAMVVGAVVDGASLYREARTSARTGNWKNTEVEGARIAGGWTGAWAGAEAGGTLGATIGAFGGPVGIAVGGAVGGFVGGALGYWGGSKAGQAVANRVIK